MLYICPLLLLLPALLARNLQAANDICYGAILDAGSSSTKTTVYQWKCRSTQSYPDIDISIQAPSLRTRPGISTVYPDTVATYMTEIFDFLAKNVPSAAKSRTPIFLGATAGMRLLDTNDQTALIDQSGYLFETASWARVISGQDEASYLWLSVKYLLNSGNIATIDLGGASSQIAFTVASQTYNSFINNLTLPGQATIPLYSISYLGYGADQARISVVNMSKTGSSVITTPCYHSGYSAKWSDDQTYTIQGTGNVQQCLQLIAQFINSNCRKAEASLCGIRQIEQPAIPKEAEIYAVSGVATMASFYGLTDYKLPEFLSKATQFCSLTWSQVQANPTYASNSFIATNYFMSLYAYQLLALGYNVDDARTVHSPVTIQSQTPSWAMAAVQYQLAQVGCYKDSPFCAGYMLQIVVLALFIIFN